MGKEVKVIIQPSNDIDKQWNSLFAWWCQLNEEERKALGISLKWENDPRGTPPPRASEQKPQ